jgi:DNA-binding response OmpR family regulator
MNDEAAKILVVDDDSAVCSLITRFLGQKNYKMNYVHNGRSALAMFDEISPDLVILDINLPDTLGYNLCEEMRKRSNVLVLMLTSRTDSVDKKKGFIKGADDYLTKPFDLEELECRVKAILRRRQPPPPTPAKTQLTNDKIVIDNLRREVTFDDRLIPLTALEFDIVLFLVNNLGRGCGRPELLEKVWKYEDGSVGDQRVVDVHIGQIRKKFELIGADFSYVQTVRGIGYKFDIPKKQ